ncbi:FxSxx-COOH system tetratricopeptide repeat protein [Parafrankia elaeagni]|uniref:FxSxx-COOH system tetratricopeptide repeat protein n=1 Tax=Parafrankia elaeagni TaxID=222534 RepID=UPI0009FC2940|nr:FxSxx-COOH system tetratricopeptide repeat protein [Parafrankia elaeagni]
MGRQDFFISHAGADDQWARWIGWQLIDAGYSVELDVWDWAAGTNFVDAMRIALERADRVLAVYTDAYFAGRHAQAEHTAAFTSPRSGRIVPVVVENCQIPELYAPLIRVELAGFDEREARRRLLDGVADRKGRPPRPVAFPGQTTAAHDLTAAAANAAVFPRRKPSVWNIPARNPFFTGRNDLLEILENRLRTVPGGPGEPVAIVPLQGMGGVGKTQLAIEYAHRHAVDYHAVWWVNADNPTLATTDLIDLATALSLPADGPPVTVLRLLWATLRERTDWLLIYDNVDDPASLADLRPPDTGQMLITSRNPTLRHVADLLEVGEFDRAESVVLLRRRCPALSGAQADQVAAAVGDLPLAVEQAGCFLTDTSLDVADYLQLLSTHPDQAGLADPTLDRHPGLAAVVAASRVRLHAASPPAAALLDQLAFCAPEPVPLTPETTVAAGRFGIRVGNTATTATVVRQIKSLGLARHAGTSLQLHRLVQAILRGRLSVDEQVRTHRAAQELVATAAPGDPDSPASWPSYAALTPHVQALTDDPNPGSSPARPEPDQFRALALAVTRYLHTSGRDTTGRLLAERTMLRWTLTLGPTHPDTLALATNLAACLWALGDQNAAHALHEDTLARRRRLLGDDHPDTLYSANNFAVCLWALGDMAAARALHEDTLARRRRLLGDDHPDTLRSANNLACVLADLGERQAARALDEDTLARRRRLLGDDHPDTSHSANNLAEDLRALGDVAAARALHEDTLARQRRVLDEDHPRTLRTAHNLAEDLRALGDVAAARALHEDTLARRRRLLGDDHPDALRSANDLAVCLWALGDVAAARALHEDTLARRRRLLGDDHPDTLRSANNLAEDLHTLGDLAAARALHQDTLSRQRRVFGDDHPDTRKTAQQLDDLDRKVSDARCN